MSLAKLRTFGKGKEDIAENAIALQKPFEDEEMFCAVCAIAGNPNLYREEVNVNPA